MCLIWLEPKNLKWLLLCTYIKNNIIIPPNAFLNFLLTTRKTILSIYASNFFTNTIAMLCYGPKFESLLFIDIVLNLNRLSDLVSMCYNFVDFLTYAVINL